MYMIWFYNVLHTTCRQDMIGPKWIPQSLHYIIQPNKLTSTPVGMLATPGSFFPFNHLRSHVSTHAVFLFAPGHPGPSTPSTHRLPIDDLPSVGALSPSAKPASPSGELRPMRKIWGCPLRSWSTCATELESECGCEVRHKANSRVLLEKKKMLCSPNPVGNE